MNAAAISLLGIGAIAVMSSSKAKAAVGITVTPYITDAHRKAMAVLAPAIIGAPTAASAQALIRYNAIGAAVIALRGFQVIGRQHYVKFTVGDGVAILDRFIAAVKAGSEAERRIEDGGAGYRLTNLGGYEALPILGRDANAKALESLLVGERPSTIPLTDLGEAVLAAARERNRLNNSFLSPSTIGGMDYPSFHRIASRLASEMDASGYLESGKPPPEPTIAGGLAAAGHAVGGFAAGIAGGFAGSIVTGLVSSPVVWVAGLAFVAWRVL